MRVLLVTIHDVWGGLDGHSPLARIILGLAESGHDVLFITSDKTVDFSSELYGAPVSEFHPRVLVRRIVIPGDQWLRPLASRIPVVRSVYDRIREIAFFLMATVYCLMQARTFKPDLVYGFEIFGAIIGRVVASLLGLPLVTRFMGTLLPPLLNEAKKSFLGRLNLCRYYIHLLALRVPADMVFMTDDGTSGQEVLRTLGNQSPIFFWTNGTDFLDSFALPSGLEHSNVQMNEAQYGIPQGSPVIISVSRLAGWKRVDRIIRAFPLVLAVVPQAWYIVVGDGLEMPRLVQMAETLGIHKRVVFTGQLPQVKVRKLLAEATVFVSMYDLSNVGNPLIEALCLGKPIVTYDVGTTRQVIQHEVNGLLLQSEDAEAVAGAILRLLTDTGLALRIGEGARNYAVNQFWTWEQRIHAEVERLETLVGTQSRQQAIAS